MPFETHVWLNSLKAVEHEYRVASPAMRRLAVQAKSDPTILDSDMRFRGIGEALLHLDGTYGIRLFAEFETGLRGFWSATRTEAEPASIAEIIDRIGSGHGIGQDELTNAHRARQYRNRQIHDNQEDGETIEVSRCRSFLCRFLSKLPLTWNTAKP